MRHVHELAGSAARDHAIHIGQNEAQQIPQRFFIYLVIPGEGSDKGWVDASWTIRLLCHFMLLYGYGLKSGRSS